MRINAVEAAEMLRNMDNILILAHENPDGDAAGSAYALMRGLVSVGKKVRVCLENISKNDVFMTDGLPSFDFTPEHIVAVDTADRKILGVEGSGVDKDCTVELCIDHHFSNVFFAENTYLDSDAAAASEEITEILKIMNIPITKDIAECLYVGISTDTGCFRYGNTTSRTLRIAADMADCGINLAAINKQQFETKTKEFALLEKMAVGSMQMHFDGKCALILITHDMFGESGAKDSETSSLAALPRQIEGVFAGITMKEKQPGIFRISVRTNEPADASAIAKYLDGGGHKMAAGCSFKGTKEEAVAAVLDATAKVFEKSGII